MKRPIRSFFVVLSIVALALAPISSLVAQTTDMQALAAQALSGAGQAGSMSGSIGAGGITGITGISGVSGAAQGGSLASSLQGLQLGGQGLSLPDATARAQIAMSTPEYPVTPGDIYSLSYMRLTQTETLKVVVEGDGTVNLGIFGKFKTAGMTFRSFKSTVESKVEAAYPQSSPSLLVVSTGLFPVKVQGQVQASTLVTAWGLTRLSEVVQGNWLADSSIRDIQVTASSGKASVYDLFKASREGDLSEDPLLRPGDVVTVGKAGRQVTLEGEVRRPGTYQLKEGEGVGELLGYYGDGALESAKTDLVVVTRKASAEKPESESIVFDAKGKELPELYDGDKIRVPSREEYLPVVYVEGAVGVDIGVGGAGTTLVQQAQQGQQAAQGNAGVQGQAGSAAQVSAGAVVGVAGQQQAGGAAGDASSVQGVQERYGTVRVVYRQGMLVSQAAKVVQGGVASNADLEGAYIVKAQDKSVIKVDLEKLLYAYDVKDDVVLQANDRLVLPFKAQAVYVTGEVTKATEVGVNGLTRLSEVVLPLVTPYSSLRDVKVRNGKGAEAVYDLFKASREGDLSEDPLLRPGDVVTVGKAARQVTLEGEVRRPGTYQLKEGEGVGELLGYYGDGALESAKTDLVVVTRKASAEKPESESLVFDVKGKVLPELYDGDKVRVPSREEYLPVVYIEGAVAGPEVGVKQEAQAGNAQGVVTQQYGVTRVVYRQGILVSQVVKGIKGQLDARADLKRAFITRKGESTPIGVNLEALLYAYEAKDDVVLQAEDHVVIPYGSMYVFVTGAVTKSAWVGITGLTRLSEVVKPLETEYSSERDVKVRSEDGAEAVYDLFKASREGDLSQDPYVRPGDVVTVGKANRQVTLEGEVRRPGTYQLKEGEGVGELLGYYGDGALESAKTDLVVVTRKASAEKPESESIVFDAKGKELPELYDGDKVRVPSREEYLPVVYIEGAVAGDLLSTDSSQAQSTQGQEVQTATQNQATPEQTQASRSQFIKDQSAQGAVMQGQQSTSQGSVQAPAQALMSQTGSSQSLQQVQQARYAMMRVPYRAGLTISTLLRPMKDKLLAAGDLKQAFVVSKGGASRTPIDLEKLLYGNDLSRDIVLSPEDRIVIPFGSMYVFVTGEVTKSSWVAITGLTRLRDVVSPLLTQYSSIRDIKVVSSQGSESYYDLFKADRFGDLTQDPFLMPGDTVQLLSDVNQVTIQGEVKRPGTYQLLEGEGLKELVEYYADGFTEKANTSRLALVRYTKAKDPVGEKQQFEYAANQGMTLNQYDVVTVPAMQDLLPVVWFEGAVGVGTAGPTPETSQRVPYTFYPGETISEAAIANRKLFSAISDLSNAYIIRHGKEIPISLSKFLYDYDLQGDMPLEPNDTVIVPFRQFFVTVSGAVHSPGRYPYIPNRSWNYYVGLAGGFDTDRNSGQKVTIYDVRSQKVESKGRVIQPEDNIEAASNSWLYSFTKVSGIVSTVFTTVIVILEAINLLK